MIGQFVFDEWPDQLPEVGELIEQHHALIMQTWEVLIKLNVPDQAKTIHRVALRDHLPQFLRALARDMKMGREGRTAESRPAAREHGLQRWRQGYDLELVIRDYQLVFHAVLQVAEEKLGREISGPEISNLRKLLDEASVIAIRTFVAFRPDAEEDTSFCDSSDFVFDACSDAVIVCTLDGTILRWNEGARRLYQYDSREMLGANLSQIIPLNRQKELERSISALQAGRVVDPVDTVRLRADGEEVAVSSAISLLNDADGQSPRFVTIERNISDRVKAAEALREALDEAERANRTKSEFLANVSHELRTPMNAIIGMTELALDEALSAELRDYLETSHESAQMLLALVNDVLDISRLESGKFLLDEVPFSLRELIDDTTRAVSSRAYRKGLEFACKVDSEVPDNLFGDPLRLRQILTNLVSNAIKFTDDGEIVVEARLDSISRRGCVLRFSVSDTGIGISEADQQRIFAPFTQADSSTTRRYAGTGLGLAIASHLVNCFRGQFWVQSEPGVGSIFHFTARFSLPEKQKEIKPRESNGIASLRDLPVLVVDDNDTNRQVVSSIITEWKMKPVPVEDAQSALQKLYQAQKRGREIPLVLVDALMPQRDGFELIEEIKDSTELNAKTILMLSAADRLAFKERVEELKIDGTLEKPISQSNLLDAIVTTLGVASIDTEDWKGSRSRSAPQRSLEVLLAEDTVANRKVVERVLVRRGHKVTVVNNGREALDRFRENSFDVILMDVQMPSMDGFQATDAIRSLESETDTREHIPIIAMTAHAMAGDRQRCLSAGMDDYISKPISIHNLVNVVEKYMNDSAKNSSTEADAKVVAEDNSDLSARAVSDSLWNRESTLKRLGNDEELLCDLIGFYLEDYPVLQKDIFQAVQNRQATALERAAHRMKGLVANFDATACQELAGDLEKLGDDGNLDGAEETISRLQDLNSRLASELAGFRDSLKDG